MTEEQIKQQESLAFGTGRTPTIPIFAQQTKYLAPGIGFGQNSLKKQAEFLEMKRKQGQQGE